VLVKKASKPKKNKKGKQKGKAKAKDPPSKQFRQSRRHEDHFFFSSPDSSDMQMDMQMQTDQHGFIDERGGQHHQAFHVDSHKHNHSQSHSQSQPFDGFGLGMGGSANAGPLHLQLRHLLKN
jgi:hypothetical protein